MAVTTLGDLARRRMMNILLECEVEVDEKSIGKVSRLISDKYERLSGIEITPKDSSYGAIMTIPYEWITGVDEERRVVIARISIKK
ncbi:MAG: hypothetical protein HQ591_11305 [candidate division Zixibacteria bacterium]|nr:hypothetical protein [Candidatus Tariuqbacter arcticus]